MAMPPEMNDFSKLVNLSVMMDTFLSLEDHKKSSDDKIKAIFIRSFESSTEKFVFKKDKSWLMRTWERFTSIFSKKTVTPYDLQKNLTYLNTVFKKALKNPDISDQAFLPGLEKYKGDARQAITTLVDNLEKIVSNSTKKQKATSKKVADLKATMKDIRLQANALNTAYKREIENNVLLQLHKEGTKDLKFLTALDNAQNFSELFTCKKNFEQLKASLKELCLECGLSEAEANNTVSKEDTPFIVAFVRKQDEFFTKFQSDISNCTDLKSLLHFKERLEDVKQQFSQNKETTDTLEKIDLAIQNKYDTFLKQSNLDAKLSDIHTTLSNLKASWDKTKKDKSAIKQYQAAYEGLKKMLSEKITEENLLLEGFTKEDFVKVFQPRIGEISKEIELALGNLEPKKK